ncbi:gliding motility-associated C-terminal domain-containing protein [Pseudoflavitalea sp. X16]|uniref:gliding motility-associated C-terminal domain-containing protein n=1 Tax=Paraflavitalea devenefica TaxID=2716334 RepID=UPI001421BA95|nr:gliding motility-associated C-terminal domain-containing protein [Paraflavitalea devenefica]NII24857.1 gliding motility-associated C-terminal domain-containing protein [Paraflavitalea devenefica]
MTRFAPRVMGKFFVLSFLLNCFLFHAGGQTLKSPPVPQPAQPDSFIRNKQPAILPAGWNNPIQAGNTRTNAAACNNSTFKLRIPAATGEKITLAKLQTFPDNSYLAAGTITLSNGTKEGLLIVLSNDGAIITQKRIRINNGPVTITDAKIALSGDFYIAGFFSDGSNTTFLARFKQDLSSVWIKIVAEAEPPVKVTLDLFEETTETVAMAVQFSGAVNHRAYNPSGAQLWNKRLTPASLTELVGFSTLSYGKLGLITNCQYNGKAAVQVFEISNSNGNLLSTYIQGNGNEDTRALATTSFNVRLNILGAIKNTGPGYSGFRNIIAVSAVNETTQKYPVPFALDFTASAAMDNAGDALGYFLPASEQLIFIKHFSYYAITPEFTRQYTVTGASSIAGIARSFDGGFLFGLNTGLSDQLIMIKTDSIGTLPDCGYQTISVTNTEANMTPNTMATTTESNLTNAENNTVSTDIPASYTVSFDCKKYFCPQDPLEDSCLSTYYKTFRSNNYIDYINFYHLLRDNKQLIATSKYDRILGGINQLTYGLKLLDEKGALLKAVNVYNSINSQAFRPFQVDDRHVMLVSNASYNNMERYNITLVNDDLQQVWSKTFFATGFYAGGMGIGEVHKDAEGNYYILSASSGFLWEKPKVYIYKLDAAGNDLWTRSYEINASVYLGTISATSTASSLIIVAEATNGVSLRLDKATGQLLNSYTFAKNNDGSLHKRTLTYDAGHIFYAGGNNVLLVTTFDTVGKPIKILTSADGGSVMRAAIVKNGHLYVNYNYYDISSNRYKEVLLKLDTALDVQFIKEYQMERNRLSRGLGVSDGGYIYSGGNFSYGGVNGSYADPYLIKYGQEGEVGTCIGTTREPRLSTIAPNTTAITCTPFNSTYLPSMYGMYLVPDTAALNLGAIVCNTTPECTFLDITDPGPICQLNTDYAIPFSRNTNCTIKPQWKFDTSFAAVQKITDTSVVLRFKKTGLVWLKGELNTGCKIFKDSIELHIQNLSFSLTLGNDTTFCPGDSILLKAGAGYAQYTWQDGSSTPEFKVKQPGRYYVEVTNTCGDRSADTIYISEGIIPALTLGQDVKVCKNDTLTVEASPGFTGYSWESGATLIGQGQQIQALPLQNAAVMVEGITQDGCYARDTLQVQLLFPRPVSLGADTSFCASDSITLSAGSGYLQYQWNTGSTAAAITIKKPGQYYIAAQDPNGCFARDTFAVLQTYPLPVVMLGADQELCTGSPKLLNAGSFKSYQWQDGSSNSTFLVADIGLYHVTVTNLYNCIGADTINITALNPPPTGFLKSVDSICKYSRLTLVPDKTYRSYTWSTGAGNSSIVIEKPGVYTLTVTDNKGCTGKDTTVIIQKDCLYGVFIPNAFSPNGDQRNDIFRALVYGPTLQFRLQVFNRYGEQVFHTTNPDQGWDGTFKGKVCDNGPYIWQCSYHIEGSEPAYRKGHVMLVH